MAKPDKNDLETKPTNQNDKTQTASEKQKVDSGKKNKKTKKQNDAPKRNLAKESVAELKKVTWPSFKDVVKNTLIVLGIVIACTAALFLIDRVLSWLYQLMIDGAVTSWWY